MESQVKRKRLLGLFFSLAVVIKSFAGGFSLYTEGSVSELSVFAAGAAAEAPDASIGWYNPAGLVLRNQDEILVSGIGVFPHTTLTGTSTYLTDTVPPYVQSFDSLSGGQQALVPAFHLVHPLGERSVLGLSILSPFGLSTRWGNDSPLRYAGTLTELLTLVVSPEIGGYLSDNIAFGLGLDLQWARVTFNAIAGSPAALQYLASIGGLVTPTTLDSRSENTGRSFGIGFHAGLLALFNDNHTRFGLNFQSAVDHQFEGTSTLSGRLADPNLEDPTSIYRIDTLNSNKVWLPSITTLSFYQDLIKKWTLLGSIVYTGWDVFKTTQLNDVAGFDAETGLQAPITITAQQRYRNAWRFALGALYEMNEQWKLRVGGGYDQTPTINAERDVRLPDVDKWAFAVGLHYQPRTTLAFDIGYAYLWAAQRSPLNKTQVIDTLSSVHVDAWANNHAQLGGVQVVWRPLD